MMGWLAVRRPGHEEGDRLPVGVQPHDRLFVGLAFGQVRGGPRVPLGEGGVQLGVNRGIRVPSVSRATITPSSDSVLRHRAGTVAARLAAVVKVS